MAAVIRTAEQLHVCLCSLQESGLGEGRFPERERKSPDVALGSFQAKCSSTLPAQETIGWAEIRRPISRPYGEGRIITFPKTVEAIFKKMHTTRPVLLQECDFFQMWQACMKMDPKQGGRKSRMQG